jgi:hypothetical protein
MHAMIVTIAPYIFAAVSLALLLAYLYGREIRTIWLVLWGMSPVILVYALNPGFRVYSFHSFMHGGIVYQIMNGNIPPPDPLVAGYPVHYPWGAHLVAAGISSAFRITPFYSLAIMNVLSLGASMVLVYQISRQLIADDKANVLSVMTSLFGITVIMPEIVRRLPDGFPTEMRGVPLIHKFITINNLPVGVACLLLGVCAALRLIRYGRLLPNALLLFGAVAGTGFFYPGFLPGVIASIVLGLALAIGLRLRRRAYPDLTRLVILAAVGIGAVVLLRPYLISTGGGTVVAVDLFGAGNMAKNMVKYLVVTLPILIIIYINRRALRFALEAGNLLVISVIAAATLGSYAFIHLPFDNEYKLLLASACVVGIVGGIAFRMMERRHGKLMVFILLAFFLLPSLRVARLRITRGRDIPGTYTEEGINLESADPEHNEFYRWIRQKTDPKSTFIDTELEFPVLAQRQMLVAMGGKGRKDQKGFGSINIILQAQSGYDQAMLARRRRVVDKILGSQTRITEAEMDELRSLPGDLYVVARTDPVKRRLTEAGLREIYRTSHDGLRLFLFEIPGHR